MKDKCWFLNKGGGGSPLAENKLIVRRTAAIGDALCATVVSDALAGLGFEVEFQTHPNIHCVLRRHPLISSVTIPNGHCHVNLDATYERDPARRSKHFHQMFFEAANAQLKSLDISLGKPRNCKPRIIVEDNERAAMRAKFEKYPRPWVFICPRSNTYAPRTIQDGVWEAAARDIAGTKFWLGTHGAAPPGVVDLQARHLDNVILWLAIADLFISVDTGPLHIAAALNTPIVGIAQSSFPHWHLNDQCDFVQVEPQGLDCLDCQLNLCPKNEHLPPCQNVDPKRIAEAATLHLRSIFNEDVAALVPIYQPDVKTLNRCLESLLPQVAEVIVSREINSKLPAGALTHPRVRYVFKNERAIGYGRSVNYGARHSTARFLLLCNDDIFLDPGAVDHMKEIIKRHDRIGMVSGLLRYPDGTIYHAGKRRSPGERGWAHIDHRQKDATIHTPEEMENVCGACVLVRRNAFYDIGGFDERFFVYAEDDDFALSLRRNGWRIWYTPHATGIHLEHQSTSKVGEILEHLARSNTLFGEKWSAYFDHNINRVPGDFNY